MKFQSTPSVWRETPIIVEQLAQVKISIHSLRVEGDVSARKRDLDEIKFQSTPSVWRETTVTATKDKLRELFQSTPSVWRETTEACIGFCETMISIHSLRVEGDVCESKQ